MILPKFILDSILKNKNCIDDFFNNQIRSKPIILFGAGFALNNTLQKFIKQDFTIACICDNNPDKHGTFFDDKYEVLSLDDSLLRYPDALYIITSPVYFWEIHSDLIRKIGAKKVCDIDFECSHYFNGAEFLDYVSKNKVRFETLIQLFSDELSQKTMYKVLKAHSTGKRVDFEDAQCEKDDWYQFKSLLKSEKDSVYLDCGAFDGDTVLLFKERAVEGYGKIYAFEPDSEIQYALSATIKKNNINKVTIVPKGVYDFIGKIGFKSSGMYSSVSDSNSSVEYAEAENHIEVTKIDEVLNGERADIIKMDLEGAEYRALIGAEKTIKTYKPKLGICLYHNVKDLLEIPELIHKMVPEYKLYIRHHSNSCTDTILYAVL